jgi:hypothetical protein
MQLTQALKAQALMKAIEAQTTKKQRRGSLTYLSLKRRKKTRAVILKKAIMDVKSGGICQNDEDDKEKGVKGSKVIENNKDDGNTTDEEDNDFNPNDPNLYNLVPMRSDMFTPGHISP